MSGWKLYEILNNDWCVLLAIFDEFFLLISATLSSRKIDTYCSFNVPKTDFIALRSFGGGFPTNSFLKTNTFNIGLV